MTYAPAKGVFGHIRRCTVCEVPIEQKPGRGRMRLTCSEACRKSAKVLARREARNRQRCDPDKGKPRGNEVDAFFEVFTNSQAEELFGKGYLKDHERHHSGWEKNREDFRRALPGWTPGPNEGRTSSHHLPLLGSWDTPGTA